MLEFPKLLEGDWFIKSAHSWLQSWEVHITEYVIEGENTITIELFASNRNLLGPHHHIGGELFSVGPDSFSGKWSWVEKKSETETTTPQISQQNYWQDDYCFVKFGLPKEE